jgi:hypothetical protein
MLHFFYEPQIIIIHIALSVFQSILHFVFFRKQLTNSVAQEPEGSSPHSQQPATGPCPEPVESNPHPPSQSP